MSRLKEEVIRKIKADHQLKALLSIKLNKSSYRIEDYLKENNILLTTYEVLLTIQKHFGYSAMHELLIFSPSPHLEFPVIQMNGNKSVENI